MMQLKLGTRRSLLAWAQSSWVARKLESLNPGLKVELVGIETQGDRLTDIPLQKVEGKEFFVAEIDAALLSGEVDLTVHSMKDLSLSRDARLKLAAIPQRENPRDVILFKNTVLEKLKKGELIKIGTSSPRRLENIPPFLERALPNVGTNPNLSWLEIRGNVNTRLSRLQEPESSSKHLDGVVLAFAGLIRLWNDLHAREELTKLFQDVRWMVLPLRECPTAPAQGALAIECRVNDGPTFEAIQKLHDQQTAHHVSQERNLLAKWGGGCHQAFGATSIYSQELGDLFFIRGKKPDKTFVQTLEWKMPHPPSQVDTMWDGSQFKVSHKTLSVDYPPLNQKPIFVANARAVTKESASLLQSSKIWTSGTSSWFKLAKLGLWVEGCAEGLGFEALLPILEEPILKLSPFKDWTILTHASAVKSWKIGRAIATYSLEEKVDPDTQIAVRNEIKQASHLFWNSGSQFNAFGQWSNPKAHHACGPGKTAQYLKEKGVSPLSVFPNVEEWKKWLKTI